MHERVVIENAGVLELWDQLLRRGPERSSVTLWLLACELCHGINGAREYVQLLLCIELGNILVGITV